MPSYTYKALLVGGQEVAGECEAADRAAAVRELASRGTHVTEIREHAPRGLTRHVAQVSSLWPHRLESGATKSGGRLRVRPKQVAILTRQLAITLEAGLPLLTALNVMGQELDHAPSRELLKRLSVRVQEGASLSDALAEHPRTFSRMYIRLVLVGEASGALETILAQLAAMLERQSELRERVKTASIYPAIVLLLGIASVIVIVAFIVPRIIESIGTDTVLLPWPTRVLMGATDIVRDYWWLLGGLTAALAVAWRQIVLRGPGRMWWDRVQLRSPVLGRLIRQLESSRFARSLGVLARGGVAITEALAVVRDTLANQVLRQAVGELGESIRAGEPIATPLHRSGLFPPLLVQMVRVGENTGRLDEMLLRAADVHETEARVTLDRLVSVLPVLMILVLAAVIGFIVAGLVLAIVEFQTAGVG